MAVRREDPNEPDYAPSPLVEAVLGILEDANVDETTHDAIALVVEAAESQVAGQRPMHNPRLAAALQGLRARSSDALDALRSFKNTCEHAAPIELMTCIHKDYERACAVIRQVDDQQV